MTPAAAAAPFPRPTANTTPQPSSISQKRRKTQDAKQKIIFILYVNGVHRNEFLVLKIIFILYVNGGAQERKYDFIKIFFQWVGKSFKFI